MPRHGADRLRLARLDRNPVLFAVVSSKSECHIGAVAIGVSAADAKGFANPDDNATSDQ